MTRQRTPMAIRAIPPVTTEPVRFEPHQELNGCAALVGTFLVFAGGCLGMLLVLWAVAVGSGAGV
jgi:hypothetical protein